MRIIECSCGCCVKFNSSATWVASSVTMICEKITGLSKFVSHRRISIKGVRNARTNILDFYENKGCFLVPLGYLWHNNKNGSIDRFYGMWVPPIKGRILLLSLISREGIEIFAPRKGKSQQKRKRLYPPSVCILQRCQACTKPFIAQSL